MGDPTSRRKAYKLKSPVTRDSFLTWDLNHRSFCRQNTDWLQFLPGGTNAAWKRFDEDETQGINVFKTEIQDQGGQQVRVTTADLDADATNKARGSLQEFLVVLGTYAPENFLHTIVQESISYNWVLEKIKTTFSLNTKGLGFLAANDLKFDIGEDGQTYQQVYQAIKEFYCSSLLKKGDKHEGVLLDKNEPLTPLCKNFIVEKWLDTINPGLKSHIRSTRGSLFNDERPSLYDNQLQLCEQMATLLQELESNPQPTMNRTVLTSQPGPTINRSGFPPPNRRYPAPPNRRPPQSSPRFMQYSTGRTNIRGNCPSDTCIRCYEAGRRGPSSKTHYAARCPFNRSQPQQMRVLLLPADQPAYQDHLPAQIQEIHLNQDLLQQGEQGHDLEEQFGAYGENQEHDAGEYYANAYDFIDNKDTYQYNFVPNDEKLEQTPDPPSPSVNVIPTRKIQKFTFLCNRKQASLALDSGCEGNCITEAETLRLGIQIFPLEPGDRIPSQADGSSTLEVTGAAITTFIRDSHELHFHGYVVKQLSQPILCGLPFIETNNIVQYVSRKTMMIGNKVVMEDPPYSQATNLPFNINEVPFYIQEVDLNNLTNLHSMIEIGDGVSKALKHRLNTIHSHHKTVFDGNLSSGYNGASGNHDVDFDFNNNIPPSPHKGTIPNYYTHDDAVVL